jgi:shikimate dehydrogenase
MFNAAFRHLGLDAVYLRMAAWNVGDIVSVARQMDLAGLNITSPFKSAIISHLDGLDPQAEKVGSVNTVVRTDAGYIGYNTDIEGVRTAVREAGFDPTGRKVVVLAGGAARAAAFALRWASVTMMNRTFANARDAADALGCDVAPITDAAYVLKDAHLLVSAVATPQRVLDSSLLRPDVLVFDAVYSPPSVLVGDAAQKGCPAIDAREWLLGQAIPAFTLFTGREAPSAIMRKALFKTRRDNRRNVALIGFMGTGKTIISEKLSDKSGLSLLDMDRQIEESAGATIVDIFRNRGEEAFRTIEQAQIDTIRLGSYRVVALGGGAVTRRANIRVLRNNCLSIWLWADVPTILSRVAGETKRPLLATGDARETTVRTLLTRRLPLYASCADLLISTIGKGPEEIANRIWDEIHHAFTG